MWIATTTGFYSAVAHKTDTELLVVRSRVLQDAEALARAVEAQRGVTRRLRVTLSCNHVTDIDQPRPKIIKGDMLRCETDYCGGRHRAVKRIRPRPSVPLSPVEVVAYKRSDYPWRVIIGRHEWAAFIAAEAAAIDYTNFKDAVTKRQGWQRHDVYSRVWSALLALSRLPGAMKDHDKRAVPHPLYDAHRTLGDFVGLGSSKQPVIPQPVLTTDAFDEWWDAHGGADDEDPPHIGDPGHEDCTTQVCVATEDDECE